MKKLKIGIVGLGKRGYDVLENVLVELDNIEIIQHYGRKALPLVENVS